MRNILWLASWYPNVSDPLTGDFIKRQAQAVSLYQPLKIIFAGKYAPLAHSSPASLPGSSKTVDNVEEYILYYPARPTANRIFSKIQSFWNYFNIHKRFIDDLRKNNELPDLVHVQVAMKAGLVALYLKNRFNIPYVLTEHWTGYYQQAKESLFKRSFLEKYLIKRIIRGSSKFLPVCNALGEQINQYWVKKHFQKIPNVVDTRLFYPAIDHAGRVFRFIHVSSLVENKNPDAIIRVFTELVDAAVPAELVVAGPLNNKLIEYMRSGKLRNQIRFTGEIPYEQVGIELRNASALVMFSSYENFPCVILEALCSGIPVISTNVGGIREVIHKGNGILIEPGNEMELKNAMQEIIQNYHLYDKTSIAAQPAAAFSYETVGQQIVQVYNSVLNRK